MILVITTQYMENYGAHDWDGEGECPQYWKFKGGSSFKVKNIPNNIDPAEIVDLVRGEIEHDSDYAREYIISYGIEDDSWMSPYEQSQLEYDGAITYPEPELDYCDLKATQYFGA